MNKLEEILFFIQVLDQLISYKETKNSSSVPERPDIALLLPNVSLEALLRTRQFLNASNPRNIWRIMVTFRNVSIGVSNSLSHFNWDIFFPVKDELELESLSGNDQRQIELGISYIVAGVVFDQLDLNSTFNNSKTAKIRIRTNISAVIGTTNYKEV